MGCLLSFKWLFALIGYNMAGFRGAMLGFLLGLLVDSMYSRPTIHFTYYTDKDFHDQNYQRQTYQPYVDHRLQDAYKTLGVTEDASDDEVRQAYRQLALRYHPDRVTSQGEQARKAAERIFQQIGEAKDIIFKVRGIK